MKLDEKWRQLVAESHAARKVLDDALAPLIGLWPDLTGRKRRRLADWPEKAMMIYHQNLHRSPLKT